MADTTKIVEMLWKALANFSIENDMDNIENKIFVRIGSTSKNIQNFTLTKPELIEFVNDQVSAFS